MSFYNGHNNDCILKDDLDDGNDINEEMAKKKNFSNSM